MACILSGTAAGAAGAGVDAGSLYQSQLKYFFKKGLNRHVTPPVCLLGGVPSIPATRAIWRPHHAVYTAYSVILC